MCPVRMMIERTTNMIDPYCCTTSNPDPPLIQERPAARRVRWKQKKEATVGFEPTNNGFAIHRLSRLATSPLFVLRNLEKDC